MKQAYYHVSRMRRCCCFASLAPKFVAPTTNVACVALWRHCGSVQPPHLATPGSAPWKPFDVSFLGELKQATKLPVSAIPFTSTQVLLHYVRHHGVAYVQGSPSCGKSSLARDIEKHASSVGYSEVCFLDPGSLRDQKEAAARQMDALERRRALDDCLFIVDEATHP